jgi:hypothetical protein
MAFQILDERERKMLERVGVLPKIRRSEDEKVPTEATARMLLNFLEYVRRPTFAEEKDTLAVALRRIGDLEKAVQKLKEQKEIRKVPSKADFVYSKFKDELEKEHFGKIVAIDVESEKIVGCGNSILEAYRDAMQKQTIMKQFAYRRVGFDFVHKL